MSTARVHDPSPRKLARARELGDALRSTELVLGAALACSWLALSSSSQGLGRALSALMTAALSQSAGARLRGEALLPLHTPLREVAAAATPFLIAPALAVLALGVAQSGFALSRRSQSGVQPVFAWERVQGGVWAAIKLCMFAAMLAPTLRDVLPGLVDAWQSDVPELVATASRLGLALLGRSAAALLAIAVVDMAYQRWRRTRRLRMSRREMDDERRESEGEPHVVAERKRRAREAAAKTAVMQLSDACMLVHDGADHAVALRVGPGPNAVPQVWIKVQGQATPQVRQSAVERSLSVYLDAPLTAALLKLETTEPIPPALYPRVATLLARQRLTAP